MKIADEPVEEVEAALRADDVEVRREPYDPSSRNLVSDFVGFLRSPKPGSTVTLFEDENGRVKYYTVTRTDPELASLRAQVEELAKPGDKELPSLRLDRIEKRLEKVDAIEAKVAKVDELAAAAERLPALEAKVEKVDTLETRLGELKTLKTRLDKLEKT